MGKDDNQIVGGCIVQISTVSHKVIEYELVALGTPVNDHVDFALFDFAIIAVVWVVDHSIFIKINVVKYAIVYEFIL